MLMQKKITRNRKISYLIMIAILASASVYIIYVSFLEGRFVSDFDPDNNANNDQEEIQINPAVGVDYEKIEFTDSFLNKAPYINLKPAPISSVGAISSGRPDPFLQVQSQTATSTEPKL